jgi:hypothetical protein
MSLARTVTREFKPYFSSESYSQSSTDINTVLMNNKTHRLQRHSCKTHNVVKNDLRRGSSAKNTTKASSGRKYKLEVKLLAINGRTYIEVCIAIYIMQ